MISDKEKVEVYEKIFHYLQARMVAGNRQGIEQILQLIWDWSYSHRSGNGELSDEEQQERIDKAFNKLKEF